MNDLISRQDAITKLKKAYWEKDIQSAKDDPCIVDAMTDWAIRQVKDLPSAQPSPCEFCIHNDIFDDTACLWCRAETRTNEEKEE